MFRLRVRPGRAVLTFTSNPGETPVSASAGEEIFVPEEVAAPLIRGRTVDVVEIIEPRDTTIDAP
jgi:hypothetical protein